MELKQFIKLISEKRKLFGSIWLAFVALGMILYAIVPAKQIATLSIDIARDQQTQQTPDYQFDQFYRLEADDRFANTLVQWTEDPNVQRKIRDNLKDELSKRKVDLAIDSLKAVKRSANLVQVIFIVDNSQDAAPMAQSIYGVFQSKTSSLNNGQDQGWFKIIGSGPTVNSKKLSFALIFFVLVVGGLLLSLFTVLANHYFSKEEKKDENRN